jgi:hypothetical protein
MGVVVRRMRGWRRVGWLERDGKGEWDGRVVYG